MPRHICVILDEAYCEYALALGDTTRRSISSSCAGSQLVPLRTFSKVYGLAGLRVGYGLCGSADFRVAVDQVRQPFYLNSPAQAAAVEALRHQDEVERRVVQAVAARSSMVDGVRALGLWVAESDANFIWLHLPDDSAIDAQITSSSSRTPTSTGGSSPTATRLQLLFRGHAYVVKSWDFTDRPRRVPGHPGRARRGQRRRVRPAVARSGARRDEHALVHGPDVARMAFWVGDAPQHDDCGPAMATAFTDAQGKDILQSHPVSGSGADELLEYTTRSAAHRPTGGRYLFLTDDSGVGGRTSSPTIPCYFVTKLGKAIVRMGSIELSGVYREPDAADADFGLRSSSSASARSTAASPSASSEAPVHQCRRARLHADGGSLRRAGHRVRDGAGHGRPGRRPPRAGRCSRRRSPR